MYDHEKSIKKLFSFLEEYKIHLTENDLLNFLKITNRWPYRSIDNKPTVEIITEWSGKCKDEFYDITGKFNFNKWKEKYDRGFTSILSDVLDLTEELRNLQNEIVKISGKNIQGNFYFTKGSINHRISFDDHIHEYPVLVKIIYGNCKWKIENDYWEVKSGDVLHIPAGYVHSVVECVDRKLSLTLNFE